MISVKIRLDTVKKYLLFVALTSLLALFYCWDKAVFEDKASTSFTILCLTGFIGIVLVIEWLADSIMSERGEK